MELFSAILSNGAIWAVVLLVIALIGVAVVISRRFHTVSPNEVAIISGKQRKIRGAAVTEVKVGDVSAKETSPIETRRGFRVVKGGAFFLWPIVEKVQYMSLNAMSIKLNVIDAPANDGAAVSVVAIANVKIQSTEESLPLAIERFLGMNKDEIIAFIRENLESNLRAIVGTMTIEKLISDRSELQTAVAASAHADLIKIGVQLDIFNIQEVSDKNGYIAALGAKRTAEVKRDAEIGQAQAHQAAAVAVAAADQTSKTAQAAAAQAISDAQKDRDIAIANNASVVKAREARIDIVAKTEAAREQATLNQAEVTAQKERVKAETDLQAEVQKKRKAEMDATVIVDANAKKDALLIEAEAKKQAKLIEAEAAQQAAAREGEALRIKQEKEGQGKRALQEGEAAGRQALAAAIQAEGEAHAAATRATLLATADGEKAKLLAHAEGTRAELLAEAEGLMKRAEATAQLDANQQLLMLLQASPAAIEAFGRALAMVVAPIADASGKGMAAVKEVRMYDFGGSGKEPLLQQFSNMPIETLVKFGEQARAAGFGHVIDAILKMMNVSPLQLPPDVRK